MQNEYVIHTHRKQSYRLHRNETTICQLKRCIDTMDKCCQREVGLSAQSVINNYYILYENKREYAHSTHSLCNNTIGKLNSMPSNAANLIDDVICLIQAQFLRRVKIQLNFHCKNGMNQSACDWFLQKLSELTFQ